MHYTPPAPEIAAPAAVGEVIAIDVDTESDTDGDAEIDIGTLRWEDVFRLVTPALKPRSPGFISPCSPLPDPAPFLLHITLGCIAAVGVPSQDSVIK